MIYGSVCSGIEAATVAWHPLGWKAAFYSEIEAFPRAVLSHHYPDVPLHGDFTTIKGDEYGSIDLLCGGTPCQSFSVAGLRKGLADDRGNLSLEFIRLAQRTGARWLVWENVPGVMSSNKGRDFGAFLGGLAECGYGFAYRVLDAQHFGVPQRRRRVVLVGYLGDWRPPAAVLFERESLQRDHTPRREARERIAPTLDARSGSSGANSFATSGGLIEVAGTLGARTCRSIGAQDAEVGHLLPVAKDWPADVASTLNAAFGSKLGLENQHINEGAPLFVPHTARTLTARYDSSPCDDRGYDVIATPVYPINTMVGLRHNKLGEGTGLGIGEDGSAAYTLTKGHSHAVAHANTAPTLKRDHGKGYGDGELDGGGLIQQSLNVRRLTPIECERLQGFSDNYTLVPHRGKPAADGPRYKAIGNSWAVPKFVWLGERIQMVEKIIRENGNA